MALWNRLWHSVRILFSASISLGYLISFISVIQYSTWFFGTLTSERESGCTNRVFLRTKLQIIQTYTFPLILRTCYVEVGIKMSEILQSGHVSLDLLLNRDLMHFHANRKNYKKNMNSCRLWFFLVSLYYAFSN